MNSHGHPTRAGQILRQTGAVATAVKTKDGLHWQVRRDRDGLIRTTACLAHTSHWRTS
jgi:ribosomal protein S30